MNDEAVHSKVVCSTVNNLFNLSSLVNIFQEQEHRNVFRYYNLSIGLIDLMKHCESHALFYKLTYMAKLSKFLQVLRSLYKENRLAVWRQQEISDRINSKMNIRQGWKLIPELFYSTKIISDYSYRNVMISFKISIVLLLRFRMILSFKNFLRVNEFDIIFEFMRRFQKIPQCSYSR